MKQENAIQKERFVNMLLKIPAIDKCEILSDTENGFTAEIELESGLLRMFHVHVLNRVEFTLIIVKKLTAILQRQ